MNSSNCRVSILMLTHNAPKYIDISVRSLVRFTQNIPYELVVVDNASDPPAKALVGQLYQEGLISRVTFLDYNSLFAAGNNLAAEMASPDSDYFLLLNSDVEIKHPMWLKRLVEVHKPGVTAYGICSDVPRRVDGYCFLIDAPIYRKHRLNEFHQWTWGITRLQAAVLREGYSVQGFAEHETYLHHFGGRSGLDFRFASGATVPREEAMSWFSEKSISVLDERSDGSPPSGRQRTICRRLSAVLTQYLRG